MPQVWSSRRRHRRPSGEGDRPTYNPGNPPGDVALAGAYDAIVIGAGVMGASIAFHLARAGLHNTLVLERRSVCSGNTRKSGALVRMHYSNRPEASLAAASLPYFLNWQEMVGYGCGFKKVGFLLLVGPEN